MRNTTINVLATVLVSLFLCACSGNNNRVIVKGSISGEEVSRITFSELDVYESKELGMKKLSRNGHFSFKIERLETSLILMATESDDYIVLIAAPGEEIEITADGSNISESYSVSGSSESELLKEYRAGYYKRVNRLSEINNRLIQSRSQENYPEIHASLTAQMDQIAFEQKVEAEDFIRKHPQSLVSLLVFNDRIGQTQLFEEKVELELMQILDKGLSKAYPDNKHTFAHHERYEKVMRSKDLN